MPWHVIFKQQIWLVLCSFFSGEAWVMVMSCFDYSCFIGVMHMEGTGFTMLVSCNCSVMLHEMNWNQFLECVCCHIVLKLCCCEQSGSHDNDSVCIFVLFCFVLFCFALFCFRFWFHMFIISRRHQEIESSVLCVFQHGLSCCSLLNFTLWWILIFGMLVESRFNDVKSSVGFLICLFVINVCENWKYLLLPLFSRLQVRNSCSCQKFWWLPKILGSSQIVIFAFSMAVPDIYSSCWEFSVLLHPHLPSENWTGNFAIVRNIVPFVCLGRTSVMMTVETLICWYLC